jgi:hypothetical protein
MSKKYPGGLITKTPVAPAGPFQDDAASGVWTLSQAAYWQEQGLWPIAGNSSAPTVIGQAFGGGFYAGQISTAGNGVADYYLIVGPKASTTGSLYWKNANTATTGADSVIDGPQNTADMVADGSATIYPAAHFCNNLTVGGFTDWYLPAKNELEVCYYNLKPTTESNNPSNSSGINSNAVPSRGSNYTSGTPAQTSATAFITSTGAEAFVGGIYWTSTESSAVIAWWQNFASGHQLSATNKETQLNVRAIRRVPV